MLFTKGSVGLFGKFEVKLIKRKEEKKKKLVDAISKWSAREGFVLSHSDCNWRTSNLRAEPFLV